jgi:hypothetical protein
MMGVWGGEGGGKKVGEEMEALSHKEGERTERGQSERERGESERERGEREKGERERRERERNERDGACEGRPRDDTEESGGESGARGGERGARGGESEEGESVCELGDIESAEGERENQEGKSERGEEGREDQEGERERESGGRGDEEPHLEHPLLAGEHVVCFGGKLSFEVRVFLLERVRREVVRRKGKIV